MPHDRKARGRGQDFEGASRLGKAQYSSQHSMQNRRRVVNADYAKAAGFEVYEEKPGSRKGMKGRVKGMTY